MRLRMGPAALLCAPFRPPFSISRATFAAISAQKHCPLCGGGQRGPRHLALACPHPELSALQTRIRTEAGSVLCDAAKHLVKGADYLNPEQAADVKKKAERLWQLCSSGCLLTPCKDADNVIYRLLTIVPFPEALADAPVPGLEVTRALGALFDSLAASRQHIRDAANKLVRWSTKIIRLLAAARLRALPKDYYGLPPDDDGDRHSDDKDEESDDDTDHEAGPDDVDDDSVLDFGADWDEWRLRDGDTEDNVGLSSLWPE